VNHNLTAKPENMAVQEFTKTQQQNIQKQWKNAIMQKYTNQKNKQHKNTVIPMVFDYEIS
jgi:hypothetical protein